ncbi:hypothetical protein LTR96_006432 [Exophiala xenobiotica]|nr:hypothetical protein LTR96_006432 [Exophiala xenobiotica]KAK5293068.1 hypothetical protein LTR14_005418 [Exophiala xenobiotica]KAK5336918.1 hypothetical protein LTR98_007225 [Exophiala xenobiotica]KAK5484669.1 hypothetical protein LTR55_006166 [Exophiala xenobiotica]
MVIEDSPEPTFRLVKAPEVIVIEDSPEPPVHDEDIPKQSCEKDEEPNPMLNQKCHENREQSATLSPLVQPLGSDRSVLNSPAGQLEGDLHPLMRYLPQQYPNQPNLYRDDPHRPNPYSVEPSVFSGHWRPDIWMPHGFPGFYPTRFTDVNQPGIFKNGKKEALI